MLPGEEVQQIRRLISQTLLALSQATLTYQLEFSLEALIGITLDKREVFLININETVKSQPPTLQQATVSEKQAEADLLTTTTETTTTTTTTASSVNQSVDDLPGTPPLVVDLPSPPTPSQPCDKSSPPKSRKRKKTANTSNKSDAAVSDEAGAASTVKKKKARRGSKAAQVAKNAESKLNSAAPDIVTAAARAVVGNPVSASVVTTTAPVTMVTSDTSVPIVNSAVSLLAASRVVTSPTVNSVVPGPVVNRDRGVVTSLSAPTVRSALMTDVLTALKNAPVLGDSDPAPISSSATYSPIVIQPATVVASSATGGSATTSIVDSRPDDPASLLSSAQCWEFVPQTDSALMEAVEIKSEDQVTDDAAGVDSLDASQLVISGTSKTIADVMDVDTATVLRATDITDELVGSALPNSCGASPSSTPDCSSSFEKVPEKPLPSPANKKSPSPPAAPAVKNASSAKPTTKVLRDYLADRRRKMAETEARFRKLTNIPKQYDPQEGSGLFYLTDCLAVNRRTFWRASTAASVKRSDRAGGFLLYKTIPMVFDLEVLARSSATSLDEKKMNMLYSYVNGWCEARCLPLLTPSTGHMQVVQAVQDSRKKYRRLLQMQNQKASGKLVNTPLTGATMDLNADIIENLGSDDTADNSEKQNSDDNAGNQDSLWGEEPQDLSRKTAQKKKNSTKKKDMSDKSKQGEEFWESDEPQDLSCKTSQERDIVQKPDSADGSKQADGEQAKNMSGKSNLIIPSASELKHLLNMPVLLREKDITVSTSVQSCDSSNAASVSQGPQSTCEDMPALQIKSEPVDESDDQPPQHRDILEKFRLAQSSADAPGIPIQSTGSLKQGQAENKACKSAQLTRTPVKLGEIIFFDASPDSETLSHKQ